MNQEGKSGEPTSPKGEKKPDNGFLFDERYAEAILNGEHVVLGKKLKPFSAWHRTLLERIDSPIVTGEKVEPYDLLVGVDICHLEFPTRYIKPTGLWNRICEYSRKMKIERRAKRKPRWYRKQEIRMKTYLDDFCAFPKFMVGGDKKGGTISSSQIPQIDMTLMDVALYRFYTGCPRNEPWNIPLGELSWMNVAIAKTQGTDIRIITTEEDEHVRLLKLKLEADKAAKGKEGTQNG